MTYGINRVQLVGKLVSPPAHEKVGNNLSMATLDIEITEKNNKKGDVSEIYPIKTFGDIADNAARNYRPGQMLYVDAKVKVNRFKDKNGMERCNFDMNAFNIIALSGGQPQQQYQQPQQQYQKPPQQYQQQQYQQSSQYSNQTDDIPF